MYSKAVFPLRIKLELFKLAEGPCAKCASDSFSIYTQQSAGSERVGRTGLLVGQKTGLESRKLLIFRQLQGFLKFSVLLPVIRGLQVFLEFKLGRNSLARWRMKISQEECSRIIQRTLGKMTFRHL